MNKWVGLIAVCVVLIGQMTVCGATRYQIVDLGVMGGTNSWAQDINESGQVACWRSTSQGTLRAVIWQDQHTTDIGVTSLDARSLSINDSGQVAGGYLTSDYAVRSFFWQSGQVATDLLGLGGNYTEVYDINNAAQIVGCANQAPAEPSGFAAQAGCLWQGGQIATVNSYGHVNGINNVGDMVGDYWADACIISGGHTRSLPGLGGYNSEAIAIGDNGDVVGNSAIASNTSCHACLWRGGTAIDLGTLGGAFSQARGVNTHGQVIGNADLANGDMHAFVWEDGVMTDLGGLGGTLTEARGMNESGWICGSARTADYRWHAVLWQPVPEPSAFVVLLSGIAGVWGAIRRKRG